mgnify:CR=1 FL=1
MPVVEPGAEDRRDGLMLLSAVVVTEAQVREASLQKIPYALVLGEKEKESRTINVRSRDKGELGEMTLDAFVGSLEPFTK